MAEMIQKERVYFVYTFLFNHQRKSEQEVKEGRNLPSGTDAEPMGHLPRVDGTAHSELSLPPSVTNLKHVLHAYLQADLMEAISPQMTLSCVKVT